MQIIMLYLLTLLILADYTTSQWSHHDENSWPGMCTVGKEQSPINIETAKTRPDPKGAHIRGPLRFRGYDDVAVTARNTGYTIRWSVAPGTTAPVLSGGPLRGNYTFRDVHFHWLSEHLINGLKYPLEIHLVHLRTGLTMEEALRQRDGVAVIGVVAEVGLPGISPVLDDLMPAIPSILVRSNETGPFHINLTQLFGPRPQEYFTYHGSLTTPECHEAVTWIVMGKPTLVSHDNYKNLTRVQFSGINNDRSVRPVGSRVVYRSSALASCSQVITPSLGSWAVFLSCVAANMSASVYKGICGLVNIKRKLFGKEPKMCF